MTLWSLLTPPPAPRSPEAKAFMAAACTAMATIGRTRNLPDIDSETPPAPGPDYRECARYYVVDVCLSDGWTCEILAIWKDGTATYQGAAPALLIFRDYHRDGRTRETCIVTRVHAEHEAIDLDADYGAY